MSESNIGKVWGVYWINCFEFTRNKKDQTFYKILANERLKAPNNCYKAHSRTFILLCMLLYCYWHYSWKFIAICSFVHWLNLLLSCCLFLCCSGNLECKMENFSSLVLAIIGGYINCTCKLNFRNKSFVVHCCHFYGENFIKKW